MSEDKSLTVPETPASNEVLPTGFEEFARKASLGVARKLGEKTAKFHQQQQLLTRKSAISTLQDMVVIGKVAQQVGLTAIPLTDIQLRGALALVVQQAHTEEALAKYAAAGQAWIDARRPARESGKLDACVTATTLGPELVVAGKQLRLSHGRKPKRLHGKLTLADATDLGQRFLATVTLYHGRDDDEYVVVKDGAVDGDVVALLEAELGVSRATHDGVEEVSEVNAVVVHTVEEQVDQAEPGIEGHGVPTHSSGETVLPRHSVRPTLHRRPGSAA